MIEEVKCKIYLQMAESMGNMNHPYAPGCIIVKNKQIIGAGYTHKVDYIGERNLSESRFREVDAELDALLNIAKMGSNSIGADIFMSGMPKIENIKYLSLAGINTLYLSDRVNIEFIRATLVEYGIKFELIDID